MDNYLCNMVSHWGSLKKIEGHYNAERIKTEQAIQDYLHEHDQWKPIGTMNLGDLKIKTSLRRKWNQEKLLQIKGDYQLDSMQFPFAIEYKEIKSKSEHLETSSPELWQILEPALTVSASKPYFFSAKKEED